jgi:hypothetical protein
MQRVLALRPVTKYWFDEKRKRRAITKYPNIFVFSIVSPEYIMIICDFMSTRAFDDYIYIEQSGLYFL